MKITRPHIDNGDLAVFLVYVREAHPSDGWSMPAVDGMCYMRPKSLADRVDMAKRVSAATPAIADIPFLVDDPTTNELDLAYEAPPERFVVIDDQMKVAFASGQGPMQYSQHELADFLHWRLYKP